MSRSQPARRAPGAQEPASPMPPLPPTTAGGGPISHAIFRVARSHRLLAAQLLRRAGLYPGQELLMMQLWDAGAQPQSQLIQVLGLDASTVTRMVQRLEHAGFVRRRRSEVDRRVVLVEPTMASQALREQVARAWRELEEITLRGFSDADLRSAGRLLDRIEDNIGRAVREDDEGRTPF